MLKKVLKLSLSVILAASITGCSLFAPGTQVVTVNGQPAGAIVTINGNTLVAPAQVTLKTNRPVSIMVSKAGYVPVSYSIGTTLSTFGLLDIIGGFCFLVPFIGLVAPGAFTLDQQHFNYYLTPQK